MNNQKVAKATTWASITEIAAKLVTPISNMILARLLTPEAFGVVATATMIFSFADMFTDSGFQKYLVQHEFRDATDREQSTTVAFWTNICLSFLLWGVIAIFSEPLAVLVGNPGLGSVIVVACASLPLTSFSSIQMALYRRDFDFKTLFYVRMVSVAIPLIVTIPLALMTHSYWALIVGTICGNLSNAVILTWRSAWKPRLFYDFAKLKEMLSFSIWSLIEAISLWLTNYIGVFIVGAYLTTYYLGLYKTSMNTVNQIMNLVTAATTPVLFAALSRQQGNKQGFQDTFFSFQRNVGLLIIPMGVGLLMYQSFATKILLGDQWSEAAGFIGLWAWVNSVKIIFSNFCSEAYRAVGRPKVSVFVQISQLIVLVPAILYGTKQGFETLYVMRCLVSVELIIVNLFTVWFALRISPLKMVINVLPELIAAAIMAAVAFGLKLVSDSLVWSILSIGVCVLVYGGVILSVPGTRKELLPLIRKVSGKLLKKGALHRKS